MLLQLINIILHLCVCVFMQNVSSKPVLSNVDLYNWGDSTVYHYYVHDHQGSVRAVIDETGALVQATDYSACGVPSTRYAGTATNNHLHLGLEWQPMKGLYGYYNNARFRDPLLAGTFYQLDPLAEKYYPFSPYHYGACNPLLNIDFNGMDIWDVDPNGYVTFYQKTDIDIDQINMVDKNGLPLFNEGLPVSISLEGGAIEKQYSWEGLEGGQNDYWQVRGDDNATALFEFMSEHITGSETMVEMGWAMTGIAGDNGLNFITTSHTAKEEKGIGELYKGQLGNGYVVRELIHSHPIGDGTGKSDGIMKAIIMTYQFGSNLPIPQFSIYYQPEKKYLKY